MSETLRHWLGSLEISDPAGQIILIGCGSPATLAAAAAKPFKRITVVEPDPAVCARLASAQDDARIEIRQIAAAEKSGDQTFSVRNWRAFSGLRPLGPGAALFPGLREERTLDAQTTTLAQLLEALALDPDAHNVLRVCLSAAGPVLASAAAMKTPPPFRDIFFDSAHEPAFQGDAPAREMAALLDGHGLSASVRADTDPDFPEFWLGAARNGAAVKELEAALDDARQQAKEHKAAAAALMRERDAAEARAKDAEARAETREARIKELTDARDALRQQTQEQLDEARSASSVALRMQALRDADLRDLQERYARVVEERDTQAALLQALTARLTEAESYLSQIGQDDESAEAGEVLPQSGGAAPVKSGAEKPARSRAEKAKARPASTKTKSATKSASGKKRGAKRS